jgi:hypothetical protein
MLQEQDEATRARRYRFGKQSERKKLTLYLELEKIQVDGGRNYYPTSFKFGSLALLFQKTMKKYSLGPHFFTQKPPWNKPNQVKPTLLSLLFWNGLMGFPVFIVGESFPLHVYLKGSTRQPPW